MFSQVISLIVPFVVLSIFSVMVDRLTLWIQAVMKRIPFLPDSFEPAVAYAVVLGVSYLFCWQGNYDLFSYLMVVNFNYSWEGWLATALVVSGGSTLVRTNFELIQKIPMNIGSIMVPIRGLLGKGSPPAQGLQVPMNNYYNGYGSYGGYGQSGYYYGGSSMPPMAGTAGGIGSSTVPPLSATTPTSTRTGP